MTRLAWLVVLALPGAAYSDPRQAVVRLGSHGASGVVIRSAPGLSLILTAAHAFEGAARCRAITLDVPAPSPGTATGRPRLVKIDPGRDLALVALAAGPLPNVCPVATLGHWTPRAWSCGYDRMTLPPGGARCFPATRLDRGSRSRTFTRERPVEGRSGGALISEHGLLVGLVHGYERGGRGIYISLTAIHEFLGPQARGGLGGARVPQDPGGSLWQGPVPAPGGLHPSPGRPAPPRLSESWGTQPGCPPGRT